jgi:hypothetical protein
MYWNLLKLVFATFAPVVPVGSQLKRPDPTKNEWIFSYSELKSPFQLAREVYLEQKAAYKIE